MPTGIVLKLVVTLLDIGKDNFSTTIVCMLRCFAKVLWVWELFG